MKKILVFGASGFAKVAIDIIEKTAQYSIAGLVDRREAVGTSVFNYPVIGTDEDVPRLIDAHDVSAGVVPIGDNWTRHRVARNVAALAPGLSFPSIIHPSAQLARGVRVGRGTIIAPGAVVDPDVTIGEFVLVVNQAAVGHDASIGDVATVGATSVIGGGARVGAFSVVGMAATVIHEVVVGEHTVIGAGATVIRDIGDRAVAYGVPAKVIRSREAGDAYL